MAFKFDIWQEGKYLDVWSLVHLLSGVLVAGSLIILGLGLWTGLGISTILFILWEIFEIIAGNQETFANRFIDVIIGVIVYLITWIFYSKVKTEKQKKSAWLIFKILIVIAVLLNIWGWGASALR